MFNELKRGILFTAVMTALLGGGYHVALWGIGRAVFPTQADGSLLRRSDGTVVGSRLIAQRFTRAEYFHPRPSAVDYNAAAAGGTNFGASNPDHLAAVRARLDTIIGQEGLAAGRIPSEMVTTSGSGMDPDIPPRAAELQVARVAARRGIDAIGVRALVAAHTERPTWGLLGRARVNVLELNLALDAAFGPAAVARNR